MSIEKLPESGTKQYDGFLAITETWLQWVAKRIDFFFFNYRLCIWSLCFEFCLFVIDFKKGLGLKSQGGALAYLPKYIPDLK